MFLSSAVCTGLTVKTKVQRSVRRSDSGICYRSKLIVTVYACTAAGSRLHCGRLNKDETLAKYLTASRPRAYSTNAAGAEPGAEPGALCPGNAAVAGAEHGALCPGSAAVADWLACGLMRLLSTYWHCGSYSIRILCC